MSYVSPLAVNRPWNPGPYHEAKPRSRKPSPVPSTSELRRTAWSAALGAETLAFAKAVRPLVTTRARSSPLLQPSTRHMALELSQQDARQPMPHSRRARLSGRRKRVSCERPPGRAQGVRCLLHLGRKKVPRRSNGFTVLEPAPPRTGLRTIITQNAPKLRSAARVSGPYLRQGEQRREKQWTPAGRTGLLTWGGHHAG